MEKYRAVWAVALEQNGSVLSPCVHRTYTPLKCAYWAQRTTGTALGCERESPQSHPVPAHGRTKNLCDEEAQGTEPSVTWKGLATGVTGDKKVEASGTFGVQGDPYSLPERSTMCPNRQAGQVLRARDNKQRLCNQEPHCILMQLLPFSGLAGELLCRLPLAPSTSPQPCNIG